MARLRLNAPEHGRAGDTGAEAAGTRDLPSVDAVLRTPPGAKLIERFGHASTVEAIRTTISSARQRPGAALSAPAAAHAALARLEAAQAPRLKPVFNLTGTVLHTNLGRALLAEAAIEAATLAMRHAVVLEFDLDGVRRGERDDLVRDLLCALTGAEDATVVNNNAAAVLITLNSLARGRRVIVSRGELIEIGGSFRLPEIMRRAGAKLVEVGTTNRTHRHDYEDAIDPGTGLMLKVHPSNYRIEGFSSEVPARDLAPLARERGVPLVEDLGSGALVDLSRYGLPREPTVAEAIAAGADLVTFSGDKLLGGPQAGFIVGRRDLIARINRNPMKRALRIDKIRLAAIEATLQLYRDPDRLTARLPTLRALARRYDDIDACARRLEQPVAAQLPDRYQVEVVPCTSQVGSGAVPVETLRSVGLAIRPSDTRRAGRALAALAAALRRLPVPVLGRITGQALLLDLRCLEDEAGFLDNMESLRAVHGGTVPPNDRT
jgi:L-seryl-tRNA(Ser) seleniumtransferase